MSYLNKSEDECQPCSNFQSKDDMQPHQCPWCEGTRYFCQHCSTDHHVGGWQVCHADGKRKRCWHPKCVEAESTKELLGDK